MAIRIIDGVPGSGKSYYAVNHLLKTYYDRDQDGYFKQKTFLDDEGKGQTLRLITNIEGLKVKHESLEDLIHKAGGWKDYFSNAYQATMYSPSERVVFLIDESQKVFRKKLSGDWSDVFYYFEYHRHYGHDIYLLSQNSKKINSEITDLAEYLIHSKPRVRSITGEFSYQLISDGDILKRETLRPDVNIFNMYKSRRQSESENIRNPMMFKIVCLLLLSVSIIGGGLWYLNKAFHPNEAQAKQEVSNDTETTVVQGGSSTTAKTEFTKSINTETTLVKAGVVINYGKHGQKYIKYLVGTEMFESTSIPFEVHQSGRSIYVAIPNTLLHLYTPHYDPAQPEQERNEPGGET